MQDKKNRKLDLNTLSLDCTYVRMATANCYKVLCYGLKSSIALVVCSFVVWDKLAVFSF